MRSRTWIIGVVVALMTARPTPLLAQPASSEEAKKASSPEKDAAKQGAKENFQQGREALSAGNYGLARDLFLRSQELYPTPGAVLNLALCEEHLGMVASAWRHFQDIVRMLPAEDERVAIAKNGITLTEPRLPRLRITLASSAPTDTKVKRVGATLEETLGVEQPVDPGKHVFVVSAPGRLDRSFEVVLSEGTSESLMVEPGATAVEPVTPEREPVASGTRVRVPVEGSNGPKRRDLAAAPTARSGAKTAGFVIGGIGLVGVAAGGVTGILAVFKRDDVDSLCVDRRFCSAEGVEAERSGKALAMASTVSFIAGAVGVGVGATLVLLSGEGPKTSATLRPALMPGGAGLGVWGEFF